MDLYLYLSWLYCVNFSMILLLCSFVCRFTYRLRLDILTTVYSLSQATHYKKVSTSFDYSQKRSGAWLAKVFTCSGLANCAALTFFSLCLWLLMWTVNLIGVRESPEGSVKHTSLCVYFIKLWESGIVLGIRNLTTAKNWNQKIEVAVVNVPDNVV